MRLVLAGAVACLLAGCTEEPQPIPFDCSAITFATPPGDSAAPAQPIGDSRPWSGSLRDAVATAIQRPGFTGAPAPTHVLVLTGGGQWGAFGAGFVAGWPAQGGAERPGRPRFDVVTGVSTGAILAPFALLGEGYDQIMLKAYDGVGEQDLLRWQIWRAALGWSPALTDPGPLRDRIRTALLETGPQGRTIDVLAQAHREGRRVLVGAVEADKAVFAAIDVTQLAAMKEGAAEAVTEAIMASAALPAIFPPVRICGATFIDGGMMDSVFLPDAMTEIRSGASASGDRVTVYLVVNSSLRTGYRSALRDDVLGVAGRAASIMMDHIMDRTLHRMARAARDNRIALYPTSATDSGCVTDSSLQSMFDPAFTACLADFGVRRAQSEAPWHAVADSPDAGR